MNGAIKFHKPSSPAFNAGECWVSANGVRCWIEKVECYGPEKWDYTVHYRFESGNPCCKNARSFQVRYNHVADSFAR